MVAPVYKRQGPRLYRPIQAAAHPNHTDSSSPQRADHNAHIFAVWKALGGRGFPFFDLDRGRA